METKNFELKYSIQYGLALLNIYRRTSAILKFSTLVLSSGAVAALLIQNQTIAIAAGVLSAVATAVNVAFDPAGQAAKTAIGLKDYTDLLAKEITLTPAELQHQTQLLHARDMPGIKLIENPVWFKVCQQLGLNTGTAEPLKLREKLAFSLA